MTKFYDIAESFSYICCPFGTMLFIGVYDFSKLCVSPKFLSSFVQKQKGSYSILPYHQGTSMVLFYPACQHSPKMQANNLLIHGPSNSLEDTGCLSSNWSVSEVFFSHLSVLSVLSVTWESELYVLMTPFLNGQIKEITFVFYSSGVSLETPTSRNRGGYFFVKNNIVPSWILVDNFALG